MRKIQVIGICCLILAGCDTRAVDSSRAVQVSPENVYAFSRPATRDDARITFVQDKGAMSCFGAGMQVFMDNRLAAETSSGEKVTLYHPPGPVQFSIKNNAMCAGGDLVGMILDLRPGYSYQLRGYRGTWDKPEVMLGTPPPFKYIK